MINEVQQLTQWLVDSSFNADWTAPDGSTHPAPEIQSRWLDERVGTESNEASRIVLIRNASGGTGDRFVTYPVVTFAAMGMTNDYPVYVETLAQNLYNELLKFDCGHGIVSIEPLGRIGGPYRMESGRFVYDMEFRVTVESGYILRGMK